MTSSSDRINAYAKKNQARKYLEIGVNKGDTFFWVDLPLKIAVDPNFLFDPSDHAQEGHVYFPVTSDAFFADFPEHPSAALFADADGRIAFDIIFIDGLHTYEQTLRDFENSLRFSHDNTIWIIDDTVPSDVFSAIRDQDFSLQARKEAGYLNEPWHGDVFKALFAIHDYYPEFSYATPMDAGNPQTVLWRAVPPMPTRKARFSSKEAIAGLSYTDMLRHADLIMPVSEHGTFALIGTRIDPALVGDADTWKKLLYSKVPAPFDLEGDVLNSQLKDQLIKLYNRVRLLEKQNKELRERESSLKNPPA